MVNFKKITIILIITTVIVLYYTKQKSFYLPRMYRFESIII
jgi:hypothetical protein